VVVYRLLAANTVDQLMFERALAKKKLEQLVIHKGTSMSCAMRLSLNHLGHLQKVI